MVKALVNKIASGRSKKIDEYRIILSQDLTPFIGCIYRISICKNTQEKMLYQSRSWENIEVYYNKTNTLEDLQNLIKTMKLAVFFDEDLWNYVD